MSPRTFPPQLEQLLKHGSRLQHLNMSHNQLGRLSAEALAGKLPSTGITSVDLSWNPLGGGVALVAWALLDSRSRHVCKLQELSIRGVDLQSEDHLALAALLKWSTGWLPLRRLDISHNRLVRECRRALQPRGPA